MRPCQVGAALLATILVGALRNVRRGGGSLAEQAQTADKELLAHGDGGFVTGQIVRVDLRTQTAQIVNAGHPPPLRVRGGRIEAVALHADPPFGTSPGHVYRVQELALEPGDRLMFYTDGIIERNTTDVDVERMLVSGVDMHPRQAVQDLIRAILRGAGRLRDDATALCVDWHGGPSRDRTTDAGADDGRAPR